MTHHFLKTKKSFNAHSSTKYVRFILLKISLGATYAENVNALSHSTRHWEPRALKCQIMFPPTRLQSLFWVHPLILCKRKWHRLSNFDQFGWAKKKHTLQPFLYSVSWYSSHFRINDNENMSDAFESDVKAK